MSYGKQSGSSGSAPVVSGSQLGYIGQQNQLGTDVQKSLGGTLGAATDLYNQGAGGVNQAATNLAQTGNAISQNMGQGGAGAYSTGINALANLTSPDYQQQQIQAAMAPAQQQYAQNLAAQGAGFGGAGQMGSARQALAGQQLAGLNQLQQQQATAGVLQNIAQQRLAAGQALTGAGTAGAGLGLQGAQAGVTASQLPMQYLQQLLGVQQGIGGMSQATPNYAGTIGTQGTTSGTNTGISL